MVEGDLARILGYSRLLTGAFWTAGVVTGLASVAFLHTLLLYFPALSLTGTLRFWVYAASYTSPSFMILMWAGGSGGIGLVRFVVKQSRRAQYGSLGKEFPPEDPSDP